MRNIRSISQTQLKSELLESMESLFAGNTNKLLLETLHAKFPSLSFALIINWIPEQGEDIYWVLLSNEEIAVLEVPRLIGAKVGDVIVVSMSRHEYAKRNLSLESRRKFEAALELMQTIR